MKPLLYKDWVVIKSTNWLVFIFFYLFLGIKSNYINSQFIPVAPIILVYYLIVHLNSYDYRYNGQIFLLSLPITREQLLASRYVFSALTCSISLLSLVVMASIHSLFNNGTQPLILNLMALLIAHSMALIFVSVILFGYFKWGYISMQLSNFIFIAIFSAISNILIRNIEEYNVQLISTLLLMLLSLGMMGISYYLSQKSSQKIS